MNRLEGRIHSGRKPGLANVPKPLLSEIQAIVLGNEIFLRVEGLVTVAIQFIT